MTRLPKATAPENFSFIVRLPVATELSNTSAATSYKPTASALKGAKITRLPTAAAPRNFCTKVRLPVDTDASNISTGGGGG
eukprot:701498-Prymnesium_polylepis.1